MGFEITEKRLWAWNRELCWKLEKLGREIKIGSMFPEIFRDDTRNESSNQRVERTRYRAPLNRVVSLLKANVIN